MSSSRCSDCLEPKMSDEVIKCETIRCRNYLCLSCYVEGASCYQCCQRILDDLASDARTGTEKRPPWVEGYLHPSRYLLVRRRRALAQEILCRRN